MVNGTWQHFALGAVSSFLAIVFLKSYNSLWLIVFYVSTILLTVELTQWESLKKWNKKLVIDTAHDLIVGAIGAVVVLIIYRLILE